MDLDLVEVEAEVEVEVVAEVVVEAAAEAVAAEVVAAEVVVEAVVEVVVEEIVEVVVEAERGKQICNRVLKTVSFEKIFAVPLELEKIKIKLICLQCFKFRSLFFFTLFVEKFL